MSAIEEKLSHLSWTIAGRSSNLESSLKLLTLFYKYEDLWKTKKLSRAAQDLTAVSFSLWRSAFLAEKSGRRGVVFTDGRKFLERVIEDNAIGYANDKDAREWSFNYYTRNARASLELLHSYWPEIAGPYEGKKETPNNVGITAIRFLTKQSINLRFI